MKISNGPTDYLNIWKWVNIYHRQSLFYTGLLGDLTHDIWLKIQGKQVNLAYIKKTCRLYPKSALINTYYKRTKDWEAREIVMLDEQGGYVDFPDFVVPYELPVPVSKKVNKYRKNHKIKQVRVDFQNGESQVFPDKTEVAKVFGVTLNTIKKRIYWPHLFTNTRYRNRQLSGIKLISYV